MGKRRSWKKGTLPSRKQQVIMISPLLAVILLCGACVLRYLWARQISYVAERMKDFGGLLCAILLQPTGVFLTVYVSLYCGIIGSMFMVLYGIFIVVDNLWWKTYQRDGRKWDWMRQCSVWKRFADYLPVTVVDTGVELSPSVNYVCAYHPHGIMGLGAAAAFLTDGTRFQHLNPGLDTRVMALNLVFWVPFSREIILFCGGMSASRETFDHLLSHSPQGGKMLVVIPGGAREALYAAPNKLVLTLRDRLGFIKVAVRNGAHLLPCLAFGECDTFTVITNSTILRVQLWIMRVLSFSTPLFLGPWAVPIHVVLGNPIQVKQQQNPSHETLLHYQQLYLEELQRVFQNHRVQCAPHMKSTSLQFQ